MAQDVFISYATEDKPIADAACAMLESHGVRCWIAPRDIVGGLDWSAQIIDAIGGSRVLVLVFSARSNASPQVSREVERAVNRGFPIIPFRIEDVPLSKHMEYFISTPHWLDALEPPLEAHLEHLAETVKRVLEQLQTEPGEAPTPRPEQPKPRSIGQPAGVSAQTSSWEPLELQLIQAFRLVLGVSPTTLASPPLRRPFVGALVALAIGLLGLLGNLNGFVRALSPGPQEAMFYSVYGAMQGMNFIGAVIGLLGSVLLVIAARRILAQRGGGIEVGLATCRALAVWIGVWLVSALGIVFVTSGTLNVGHGIVSGMFTLSIVAWVQLGLVWFLLRPRPEQKL